MNKLKQIRISGFAGQDEGSSMVELSLLLIPIFLLLVGAVDFGRAYFLAIEVSSAAEAGAMYGQLNPTDTAGMQAAAKLDANDVPTITATAIEGCECSDGTSAVANCTTAPSCAVNVVNYVEVDTAYSYKPIFPYPGAPSTFALSGKSRLRAGH